MWPPIKPRWEELTCTRISRDAEHSLEVILPFLQAYLGEFELVPIVVGRANAGPLAEALSDIMDGNTLLVVSSDLSHFLDYPDAVSMDRETIKGIMDLNPAILGLEPGDPGRQG